VKQNETRIRIFVILASTMDESWEKWFCDLEKDECHLLFNEHNMNPLEGESFVQPLPELSWPSLSCDSNFSAAYINNNMGNASSLEENYTQHISSEKPMFPSYILSFEDSTALPNEPSKETKEETNTRRSKRGRNTSQIQDHIIAERKRRENLSSLFIALSAITPGLKKMDKLSILNNAIDHMKYLQNRVKDLEEEKKKKEIESLTVFENVSVGDEFYSISDKSTKIFPEIKAIMSAKDVLIRVICHKRKNIIINLMSILAAHNLSILCTNVLPFANSILNISIIAKVDREFNMAMDDLVKILNEDLLK
ncbi:Transcription factor bHLH25, partial [Mucuna pruriens]